MEKEKKKGKINIKLIKLNIVYFKLIFILFFLIKMLCFPKQKKIKVGLCAIGKKENLYAKEFLNHYIRLGYDHIFIYDNNEIGDETFEDLLKDYEYKRMTTIIDYRGLNANRSFKPQFQAYYDCYDSNKEEYDWLSFFDFDEFLELKNSTIKEYLSDEIFKKCDNIKINWLFYSDNEKIYYENKSLLLRFPNALLNDTSNVSTKSIVKGRLKINYWYRMRNPHTTSLPFTSCNSIGKIMSRKSHYNSPPNYEKACLKHYATKSLEEFCIKIKRKYPDHVVILNKDHLKKRFDYYFQRNKKTDEKLDYIKKFFNYKYK